MPSRSLLTEACYHERRGSPLRPRVLNAIAARAHYKPNYNGLMPAASRSFYQQKYWTSA